MGNTGRVSISISHFVLTGFFFVALTACLGSGGKTPNDDNDGSSCSIKVGKTVTPVEIKGGHHLYFNSSDLKDLANSDFHPTSLVLSVELEKKGNGNNGKDDDITVGINGINATRPDGKKKFDGDDTKRDGRKIVLMNNYRVNGGETILAFMIRILSKFGDVRISLTGTNLKVVNATLEINGYYEKECDKPTPTPTPVPSPTPIPVAPKVSIKSVMPVEALTSQTQLQVEFEADQSGVNFLCSLDQAEPVACNSPAIYASLGNGDHSFSVRARNPQGLLSEPATYAWTVDTVAPVITIEPIASPTNSSAVAIPFSATEAGHFSCALDGVAIEPCVSPYLATGLTDGLHKFEVTLVDNAGNRSETAMVQWLVDLVAPTVQIVEMLPATSPSSSTTREFKFAADESVTFECSMDEAAFVGCASPVVMSNVAEGSHLLQVRGRDAAGNVGPAASASWVVDVTAPTLALVSAQPAAGRTNQSDYRVEFASSEPGSFVCKIDGASEASCESPVSGSFADDGEHKVEVVAIDLAGNRSAAQNVSWVVDRAAPEINFAEILPSAGAYLNAENLEVKISSPEEVILTASFDGADLGEVTSPIALPALSEGEHQLVVSGVDAFGNALNSITHSFVVDRTNPDLSVVATYSAGVLTNRNSNSFTLSSNEEAQFECELDGAGFDACVSPLDVSGLIDGEHVFKVRSKDRAGNLSQVQNVVWNVDTQAPATELSVVQTGVQTFRFIFSANEAGSNFVCSIDGGAEQACVSTVTLNFAPGSHIFKVHAIDRAGNREPSGASITVTAQQPITTILQPSSNAIYTNDTSMSFAFSSNHPDAKFVCSFDGSAFAPCTSPLAYSGLANGTHTLQVRAVDRFGNQDPYGAAHSWTVDTVAPVIVSSTNSATTSTITVSWSTNEVATGKLNWGVGFDSSRVTSETGFATSQSIRLSGLSSGTLYSIQITGRDQAGNVYTGPKIQVRTR